MLIPFQNVKSTSRTICGVYVDGELCERDMTNKLGKFVPSQLVYFGSLVDLDISGSISIDSSLFVDCVAFVQKLKRLNMSYCKQFTEGQIVKISSIQKSLTLLDAAYGPEFLYKNCFLILANCRKMLTINVSVRYPDCERKDWHNLFRTFRKVLFGRAIKSVIR